MKAKQPKQGTLTLSDLSPSSSSELTIRTYDAFPVKDLPVSLPGKNPSSDFVESVRLVGRIIYPLIVINLRGKLVVKEGLRRLAAARILNHDTVPVREIVLSSIQGSALGLLLNVSRSENPIAELKMILELVKGGADEKLIQAATRMPIGTIRRRLNLQKLLPELKERAFRGEIRTTVAEKLARMPSCEQRRAVRHLRKTKAITSADVRSIRKAGKEGAVANLPKDLFVTDPQIQESTVDWRTVVSRLVGDAERACPLTAETDDVRKKLQALNETLGQRVDSPILC